MHPYRVTLTFLGVAWGSLDVEVSDPEIDAEAHSKREIDHDLVEFGARFGFGELQPVELVDLEYQIAQKIHAVTDLNYNRAHDLVDLQLLQASEYDIRKLRQLCERTFRWRNSALERLQVGLGVERGLAAGPGGGNGLAVHVVHHVSARKHAGNIGARGGFIHQHVAGFVQIDLPGDDARAWRMTDGHEQAGGGKLRTFARHGVLKGHTLQRTLAVQIHHT